MSSKPASPPPRSTSTCCAYLESLDDPLGDIIELPHGRPIRIGRNTGTPLLTDPHLSRRQLECTADVDGKRVDVKTLGKYYSGCNGYVLHKRATYRFKDGDVLELRVNKMKFKIVMDENQLQKNKLGKITTDVGAGKWEEIDNRELLIFTSHDCQPKSKIASFDMDNTLIKTKSGRVFPTDFDDWQLNYEPEVRQKLKKYHEDGFKLVIFTNQSVLGKDRKLQKPFQTKIENIIRKIGLPMQLFCATAQQSHYRKPLPGMWETLTDTKNDNLPIDMAQSFYVGDAAGREARPPKIKKDHSLCDRLFALNVNLKFYTPEEFFLDVKKPEVPFKHAKFQPKEIEKADLPKIDADRQEVVLMVGSQGSGKTFFCKTHLMPKGYVHVNRDQLKSIERCLRVLEDSLKNSKSVVVDNTNPDRQSREPFVKIAKKLGVPCRCFVMSTSFEHAKHNNKFRQLTKKTDVPFITDAIRNSYLKKYQEPSSEEGFEEIVKVPFVPKFDSDKDEKLYYMYLLES